MEMVQTGERGAVNLAGVERGEVERGDLLVSPGIFRPTSMFDARLRLLPSAPRELEQRTRVRLHLGTREVLARVQLLDGDLLTPGEEGLVQLRLEAPVVAVWGDRFVIRRYSPALTIGGGTVLEPHPGRRRRVDAEVLEHLAGLEGEGLEQVLEVRLRAARGLLKRVRELVGELGLGTAKMEELLSGLEESGRVERMQVENEECVLHAAVREEGEERIMAELEVFHRGNPLKSGLRREELRNLSARYAQPQLFDYLLERLEREGRVVTADAVVRAAEHGIRFSAADEKLRERIEAAVEGRDFASLPDAESLAGLLGTGPGRTAEVLGALQSLGRVVLLEGGLLLHSEAAEWARDELRRYLEGNGQITVAQYRELIGSNRKYALALLGFFDGQGFTERRGDVRVLKG